LHQTQFGRYERERARVEVARRCAEGRSPITNWIMSPFDDTSRDLVSDYRTSPKAPAGSAGDGR
jgi:hypothetical protein